MANSEGKRSRSLLFYFTSSKRAREDTTDPNTHAATSLSSLDNAVPVSTNLDGAASSTDPVSASDDTNTEIVIKTIPNDLSKDKFGPPAQPHRASYTQNSTNRSFQYSWFSQYPWLEYSIEQDAAFCYTCRHFSGTDSTSQKYYRDAVSFLHFQIYCTSCFICFSS
jgi:hypothetical protein